MPANYPQLVVSSAAQLREWLSINHHSADGIWLVTYKKAQGDLHVPYEAVVREALCFGWIDSQGKALDDSRSQMLLTPRKPKSNWSGPNKVRVAELAAAGLMHPAGLAMVELAKQTGTWTALDDVEALVEPDELTAALDVDPPRGTTGRLFLDRPDAPSSNGSARPRDLRPERSGSPRRPGWRCSIYGPTSGRAPRRSLRG
jgi:uncharacterized protein YdeI (YjbR/CyaY-like superfamily)